jgi:hypothetical protein
MQVSVSPLAIPGEQRRFQSVEVCLLGRYMLETRQEFPCQTLTMSPGEMTLFAPVRAAIGERVVVYLDQLGRFVGMTTSRTHTGFALVMTLSPAKRDRLADQLTWFANRDKIGALEDRRHERIVPLQQRSIMRLPSGEEQLVKIKDLSASGAAIETEMRPQIGAEVVVGSTPMMIVRHFAGGVAGEFARPFRLGEIDETIRL